MDMRELSFSKYHGLGNSYIVIDGHDVLDADDAASLGSLARAICNANYGIGSDGLLIDVTHGQTQGALALRIFNPDGSEAEKSGNGIRIFARWLWDASDPSPSRPGGCGQAHESAGQYTARRCGVHMNKKWQLGVVFSAFIALGASPRQGSELKDVMREKLEQTQKILAAVVTSDWASLETHSRQLERLTQDPRWTGLKYAEYGRYSSAFVRAVQDLRLAAAQRDLEKTPKAYVAVTLQCVECHRYLARSRIAK